MLFLKGCRTRNKDKVRIIALWILHRDGVPDEDRKRLFQHARLSLGEQDAVNNLVHLGSRVVRVSNESTMYDFHLTLYR